MVGVHSAAAVHTSAGHRTHTHAISLKPGQRCTIAQSSVLRTCGRTYALGLRATHFSTMSCFSVQLIRI
jgi:hypothetical protein